VLFSGHHCSWYLGAMDNGSANATMLEVARALARHRDRLRRSVRFAFWPGHTQGRYSGSTWYFDTFWEDLHDNCVLHVNVDSTGARGASIYVALGMPETTDFAMAAIRDAIGVTAHPGRQSRAGDQSFWACGVPSIFMDLSEVPAELAVRRMVGGRDDTIDKIDRDVLRRDTRVYLLATLRAASAPVLPFRYEAAARHVRETIERYQEAAGERFDLTPAISRARALEERLARVDRLVARAGEREDAAAIQRRLMEVDRELVLVDFTAAGPFDQDLAVPVPAVPLLEPACRLPALDPASNEARFLATELLRGRNKVCHHLRLALERADALVARLS